MENKQAINDSEVKIAKKNSNERKYSTNSDLTAVKEIGHPDRKHTSVMDEYKRYYGVQRKCKVHNLTREEAWEFIVIFFKDTLGAKYSPEDEPEQKYVGTVGDSKHKQISFLHWNKIGYELSIETRSETILRTSFSIHGRIGKGYALKLKKMVKSDSTIAGMQGQYSKFLMKYWHRKNTKDIFKSLKMLDAYKKEHGNLEGGFEFIEAEMNKIRLARHEKDKAKSEKRKLKNENENNDD